MTSTSPADPKAPADPVDALRLLVADLQALADRLAPEHPEYRNPADQPQPKEDEPRFAQILKTARERVAGPRAVVMLFSEHAPLKRRFLERLLGPLPNLPAQLAESLSESSTGAVRLEYGPAPERVDPTADQAIPIIRLPAPTLERGLAVIDTPAIETPAIEETPAVASNDSGSAVSLLQCAEQASAWIFVLAADHAIGKAAQTLLCQLPDQAAGLEFVVEGAEALNAAAREQLLHTLRENCGIVEPRLTLIASAATEGDEGSYWHGRFATFHSVMMLRGRERWLHATRALIASALHEVRGEIELELKNTAPGLRHARLRLGLKDLEGLHTRFHELGRLDGDAPGHPASTSSSAADSLAPAPQWQPTAAERAAQSVPPVGLPDTPAEVFLSEREARELLAAQALRAPWSLRAKLARVLPFARLPFFGIGTAARAIPSTAIPTAKGSSRPWRLLGGVWALAFVVIVLWMMWPQLAAEHESAAEWDLRQHNAAPAPKPASATPKPAEPSLVVPAVHAETEHAAVRDTVAPPTRNRAHAVIRTPLAKPVPQGLRAGAAPTRRRHSFLGISRLWSWVRHPRGSTRHSADTPTATNE